MGTVWVAEHSGLRSHVVVKFLATEPVAGDLSIERFSREAAAAAKVRSPHVVQVFDYGVTPSGLPYMVMELLEGEDLGVALSTRAPLPVPEVLSIVRQVAKALSRAHAMGVVHRDIKPENVFLCDAGSGELFVKLLDFGIAKRVTDAGAERDAGEFDPAPDSGDARRVVGTPRYMSPEQLLGGRRVDLRTDLFSLGVVAYECLTGERPFGGAREGDGKGSVAALAEALTKSPLPPSRVNPALPLAVDDWFATACARDPLARFESAKEMADSLGVALAPRPLPAERVFDDKTPSGRFVAAPRASQPDRFGADESIASRSLSTTMADAIGIGNIGQIRGRGHTRRRLALAAGTLGVLFAALLFVTMRDRAPDEGAAARERHRARVTAADNALPPEPFEPTETVVVPAVTRPAPSARIADGGASAPPPRARH
jgi:serine/threonine-protein kinase